MRRKIGSFFSTMTCYCSTTIGCKMVILLLLVIVVNNVRLTSGHSLFAEIIPETDNNNDNSNHNMIVEPKIVGGIPVTSSNQYPSHVWLDVCGGTLVAKDMVLTAAACYNKIGSKAKIGGIYLNGSDSEIIDIEKQIPHPLYVGNGPFFLNDVMLVQLKNPSTKPLQIINSRLLTAVPNDNVTTIGFGITTSANNNASFANVLNAVDLVVVTRLKCQIATFPTPIIAQHICAANGQNKGVNRGDSGSPLYIKTTTNNSSSFNTQIGINSFRTFNGTTMAVFARTSRFYRWIQNTICTNSNYKPSSCN